MKIFEPKKSHNFVDLYGLILKNFNKNRGIVILQCTRAITILRDRKKGNRYMKNRYSKFPMLIDCKKKKCTMIHIYNS